MRQRPHFLLDLLHAHWSLPFILTICSYIGTEFWLPATRFNSPLGEFLRLAFIEDKAYLLIGLGGLTLVSLARTLFEQWRKGRLLRRATSLDALRALSWKEFEELLGEAYRRKGYTVTENQNAGPDGGIDLRLRQKGHDTLVQCKHWHSTHVSVRTVRELYGILLHEHAAQAILVCSGSFTKDALLFAQDKPLQLIDGDALLTLLGSLAPADPAPAVVKNPSVAPSPACPLCNSPMNKRLAKHGPSSGHSFYGCTRYPICRGTRPMR